MKERKAPEKHRTWSDTIGQWADSIVYAFAPVAGAKRREFRQRYNAVSMHAHEGARTDETRGSSWIGSRLSPDAAIEEDLAELRGRSRELYRNDSIGGTIDTRVNLVVSYGFTPQAAIQPRANVSQSQADQWNEQLELVYWRMYPQFGRTGKESLWQCLRLTERHHGCDGESLTVLSDIGGADKPLPLTVEVIDPERLETPPDKINDPRVRMGIEYDAKGRIVAYYIRKTHPGDPKTYDQSYDRVPADRVIHVFEKWFAGQSRGLPWMTRALNRIKDGKDLGEATIIAAQVEACFAVFIESNNPYGDASAQATLTTASGHRVNELMPGGIHYHGKDQKVTFAQPSRPGNGFEPFMEWNDRQKAAAMNFPYEMLAKNWGGLSFAAGRLSLADARLFVRAQQKLLTEAWLHVIWNRMVEEAVILGAVDIPPRLYSQMPWWFQMHEWGPPAWPYALTPGEEIKAAVLAIDNNLDTKQRYISETGAWFKDVFKQRAIERQMERDGNIQPPSAEVEVQAEAAKAIAENAEQEIEQEAAT